MPSSHLYISQGRQLGHEDELLWKAWSYQQRISAHGAYPVLTLKHLARETDTKWGYLRSIVERRISDYQIIRRQKQDGTFRLISAPSPALMHVQRWILANVLPGLGFHEAAFAYRRNLSIRHCAEAHVGARWLLKMDLHDFFGTVREKMVFREFQKLGFPALLAFEMARICTKDTFVGERKPWLVGRGLEPYGLPEEGVLPQGSPTSGALANAISYRLDSMLAAISNENHLTYTRYSDDLTFSSSAEFDRPTISNLIMQIEKIVASIGFQVHRKKTRIIPPGARKLVLGLLIDAHDVRLVPEFRDRIDNHIRCVNRYGPSAHAETRRFESALSMINHVDGCLAFASDIEPTWALERKGRWDTALRKQGHPTDRD